MKYIYFVAFHHRYGTGSTEITTNKPITSYDQVQQIARMISRDFGIDAVTVINFQLLRSE